MGYWYPPAPPLGILCRYVFLSHQGQNYHQKKVCQKLEAQERFVATFVYIVIASYCQIFQTRITFY